MEVSLRTVIAIAVLTLGVPLAVLAEDSSSANFQILGPAMTSGGYATSTNYGLLGTISEFAHDLTGSLSFDSNPGFPAYPFVSTPVVSATGGSASVALSWTAATGYVGYTVSGYSVGQATQSGGPYSFTAVGNVTSYTAPSLTNDATYYFVLRVLDGSGLTIATSTEVSATPSAPAAGGGGGGGSSSASANDVTRVTLSGRAYPHSTIVLLKDGQIALTTQVGGDARFSASLSNLSAGSYLFSLYGVDAKGNRSTPLSFAQVLTAGAATSVGGIFITPTIDVDKSSVKRGDNVSIFGQAAASSVVTISVHSNPEMFVTTEADESGGYLYTLDTTPLEMGGHLAKSKAALSNEISNFGTAVGFTVGNLSVLKEARGRAVEDLNNDTRVNLIDFSIMVFWYRRPLSGNAASADLNHDGRVDLVDFSILVSRWTG